MGDRIEVGEHVVDRLSQKMLVALDDGPKKATELLDQADIDNYGKLSHRMDQHLLPAGLVDEMHTVSRKFRITDSGREFVQEHRLEVRTLDEVAEVALNNKNRAESISGTLGSLSSRVDDLEKTKRVEPVAESLEDMRQALFLPAENRYNSIEKDRWLAEENMQQIGQLQGEMNSLQRRVDNLADKLEDAQENTVGNGREIVEIRQQQESRENQVDQQLVELAERIQSLRDDLDELEDDAISDLEKEVEKMQKGRLSKLFG